MLDKPCNMQSTTQRGARGKAQHSQRGGEEGQRAHSHDEAEHAGHEQEDAHEGADEGLLQVYGVRKDLPPDVK